MTRESLRASSQFTKGAFEREQRLFVIDLPPGGINEECLCELARVDAEFTVQSPRRQ